MSRTADTARRAAAHAATTATRAGARTRDELLTRASAARDEAFGQVRPAGNFVLYATGLGLLLLLAYYLVARPRITGAVGQIFAAGGNAASAWMNPESDPLERLTVRLGDGKSAPAPAAAAHAPTGRVRASRIFGAPGPAVLVRVPRRGGHPRQRASARRP